ncbi:MAG TPA: DUF6152 family protein [Candidatus Acidoferrum sp.]|nr:DUF6152 family protein [Candidatus Acidoferrum sp.]
MIRNTRLTVLATLIAAGCSTTALAHHSAAAFNTGVKQTISGVVTEYSFRNPHVYMVLNVKKEDGTTVATEVEAGAASVIGPLGFSRDSIKVGDKISIVGNPPKAGGDKLFLGLELYKEDGTYLPLNIASKSTYTDTGAKATSIAGTWFSPMKSFMGFLGGQRGWQTTDAAKAAAAKAASLPTPQKDCQPIGEPAVAFYPVATVIDVQKDKVLLHIDWLDTERTVWLDGRKHPDAKQTFPHGHSVGHFEGNTLVVDSTNFAPNPIGLTTSLPSGTGKHLTEKYEVGPDGKSLVYSGKIEDPEFLAAPVEWSGTLEYRPDMKLSGEKCDIKTAQKFLSQ